MIATLQSAMIGNNSMLPWYGSQVPICESATIGSDTGMPSAFRWPPPTRPVANSSEKITQKVATKIVAANGLLCVLCVLPRILGRMFSRPIENKERLDVFQNASEQANEPVMMKISNRSFSQTPTKCCTAG